MKITKHQLKKLIKEELSMAMAGPLAEAGLSTFDHDDPFDDDYIGGGDVASQGHAGPLRRIEAKLEEILRIVKDQGP